MGERPPMGPAASTSQPSSSASSRTTASAAVSPGSTLPPGSSQPPATSAGRTRRAASTRPCSISAAPTTVVTVASDSVTRRSVTHRAGRPLGGLPRYRCGWLGTEANLARDRRSCLGRGLADASMWETSRSPWRPAGVMSRSVRTGCRREDRWHRRVRSGRPGQWLLLTSWRRSPTSRTTSPCGLMPSMRASVPPTAAHRDEKETARMSTGVMGPGRARVPDQARCARTDGGSRPSRRSWSSRAFVIYATWRAFVGSDYYSSPVPLAALLAVPDRRTASRARPTSASRSRGGSCLRRCSS